MQSVVCWEKKNDPFLSQNQLYTAFILICIFFSETLIFKKLDYGLFRCLCIGGHTNMHMCKG